ncbi:FG-GAP-like repeat-containing protein [Streptomyces peucetius]|uniref:FG-GAP-like repeat-containing protein n=1 Tax=Streptomyces peucetius TaxID=1950 RepID=A0ABY6IDZ9_STRPE|nr:FG-GAP-like repeat-containing protein [Streptomyces peucetius]UYQ65243.1 FG-GAP-like repeat-containing protein [Streptomyces peucetius]
MSERHPRIASAAALAALTVLTGTLATDPAGAVVGQPAADGAYAFTAKLEIGDGDQRRACSGALIEAGWVVTAASCFTGGAGELAPGKPALKTTATIGRTDLTTTGGHVSEVVDLVPRAGKDLVLARLAVPATGITPVAVADAPAAPGDTLEVAGYGRTKTEWVPDRLHTASFAVNSVTGTTLGISGATANDALCKGDTGGPVLREVNGTVELVGVSSRSWQGGCFGESETRNGAVAARADSIALGSRLAPGQRLLPGDSLSSAAARLTMQADGNLVVTSDAGKALWSSGTAEAGSTALFDTNGNLVVRNAADTATLWQSGTTAPSGSLVLQDRGNLVVHDAQGASRWAAGTVVRHDYNGDGRSDMGAWYDFSAGSDATYTFFGTADGTISQPLKSFAAAIGAWEARSMKFVTGDFNGDGRGDMAATYGYSDTSVKIWVALGRPDGGFEAPAVAWSAPAGSFHTSYMTPQAGDFDGDGRDDLAVWYAYADGTTKLWTFTGTEKGTFDAPFSSWSAPSGTWLRERTKFTTGDFDGDGRDDLAVFYGQGTNAVKTYVFTGAPNGGFDAPAVWWESLSLDWNRTTPHAGDFNGDGRDDAMVWYDYADGSDRTSTMLSENVGGKDRFGSAKVTLSSAPGNLDVKRMQQVVGDYDGDGRDDLAIMYHQPDGAVKMWTWTARPDAMFNGGRAGWTAPATSWVYASTRFFDAYNS